MFIVLYFYVCSWPYLLIMIDLRWVFLVVLMFVVACFPLFVLGCDLLVVLFADVCCLGLLRVLMFVWFCLLKGCVFWMLLGWLVLHWIWVLDCILFRDLAVYLVVLFGVRVGWRSNLFLVANEVLLRLGLVVLWWCIVVLPCWMFASVGLICCFGLLDLACTVLVWLFLVTLGCVYWLLFYLYVVCSCWCFLLFLALTVGLLATSCCRLFCCYFRWYWCTFAYSLFSLMLAVWICCVWVWVGCLFSV